MSMTPQRLRSSNMPTNTTPQALIKSGNWSKVFPTKLSTETSSCTFVKKLVTVAISNIAYLRSMFPENAFTNRSLDGLKLKILKGRNECSEAKSLADWLMGAFDALEKKYLRELLFVVYEDPSNPDIVRELYTFKFSYPEGRTSCQLLQGSDGKKVTDIGSDDIYRSTQNLLRTLVVLTQGLDPLPDSIFTMKLTYYDEVTPADYEPTGFISTPLVELKLPQEASSFPSGKVDTKFHSLQLQVKAVMRQAPPMADEPIDQEVNQDVSNEDDTRQQIVGEASITIPLKEATKSDAFIASTTPPISLATSVGSSTDRSSIDPIQTTAVDKPAYVTQGIVVPSPTFVAPPSQTTSSVSLLSEQSESNNVSCICSNHTVDPLMLVCGNCNFMSHAACYRVVYEDEAPNEHVCVDCSIATKRTCTDPKLVKMKENPHLANTCLFRRALVFLSEVDSVTQEQVMVSLGVEERIVVPLLAKIGQECVQQVDAGKWSVVKEQLKAKLLPKFMGSKRSKLNTTEVKSTKVNKHVNKIEKVEESEGSKCSNVEPTLSVNEGKRSRAPVVHENSKVVKKRKVSAVIETLAI